MVNLSDQPKTLWEAMAVTENIRPQRAAPIKKSVSEIVNVILLLCVSMDLFGTDRNHRNESGLSLPYVALLWPRFGHAMLSCMILRCVLLYVIS